MNSYWYSLQVPLRDPPRAAFQVPQAAIFFKIGPRHRQTTMMDSSEASASVVTSIMTTLYPLPPPPTPAAPPTAEVPEVIDALQPLLPQQEPQRRSIIQKFAGQDTVRDWKGTRRVVGILPVLIFSTVIWLF